MAGVPEAVLNSLSILHMSALGVLSVWVCLTARGPSRPQAT